MGGGVSIPEIRDKVPALYQLIYGIGTFVAKKNVTIQYFTEQLATLEATGWWNKEAEASLD